MSFKSKFKATVAVAMFYAFSVTPSAAHDAWVAPVATSQSPLVYPVHSGHKEPAPFVGSKVKAVTIMDANRKPIKSVLSADASGASVEVMGKPAMMLVEFDNGYWVKENGKSRNVSKLEAPQAESGSHPLKWGKSITQWTSWSGKPVGQRIEILPVKQTRQPAAGSNLTVQVLLDGKPLEGVMVENNSNEQGPKTDAKGMATLTLTSGQQRIAVDHDVPVKNDPKTDKLVLNASLVFLAK